MLSRRAFLLGALGTLAAHHRPWHTHGPTPTPTPTPLGFYSDTYAELY